MMQSPYTPCAAARDLVERCRDRELALRTAEQLTAEHFAMNPVDSKFWHEVAKVLREPSLP
jgi:hypothetical protein